MMTGNNSARGGRKKLPIGIQTFAKLREEGCYYVDKTRHALKLANEGSYYFLSRPRRFGKSLFLDTLKELFEANRPLFDGLYAADNWDWSVRHTVINVSFSDGKLEDRAQLQEKIGELLRWNARALGLELREPSISGQFRALIEDAVAKSGQKVVILIDEYDKPILDNIEKPEVAVAMRDGLRDFYSVIKGADPYLRFVFFTGVSKFSKVSLFAGLNNLRDITLVSEYSDICGYTEEDVDTVFAPELPGLDRQQIREWYNGYNWTGTAVYNPFDLLLLFAEREFKAHWYETGTPTFLIKLLKQRSTFLPNIDGMTSDDALLSTFDVGQISVEALMFQAGYLTIGEVIEEGDLRFYRMRYPNREVYLGVNRSFLSDLAVDADISGDCRLDLIRLLKANDLVGVGRLLGGFFESIPHQWYTKNPMAQYEGYYASVFYAFFASLGLDIRVEESSNGGRLDMAVRFRGRVIIFEFKLVDDGPSAGGNSALAAIAERGYADRWRAAGEPVDCVGIEFSRAQRRIVAWEVG